jgi:hypothetical protein
MDAKKRDVGLFVFAARLGGMLMIYLVSAQGRKLAKDDMMDLKLHVDKVFQCDCFELHDQYMK